MKIECFLVVAKQRGREPRVIRSTQSKPSLQANEAVIKLQIEAPDDLFEAPLITLPVAKRQVAVAIEADEL